MTTPNYTTSNYHYLRKVALRNIRKGLEQGMSLDQATDAAMDADISAEITAFLCGEA